MRDPQAIVNACAIFEDTVLNQRGKYLGTRSSSGNSFGTDLDEASSNDESKSEWISAAYCLMHSPMLNPPFEFTPLINLALLACWLLILSH